MWFIVSSASERIRRAQGLTGAGSRIQSKFSSVDWGHPCLTRKATHALVCRITSALCALAEVCSQLPKYVVSLVIW